MIESISCVIPEITVHNGRPVTTSISVANFFQKLHKDVLRKISMLESSPAFNQRNFAPVEYLDEKGEKRPAYEMTRNGFIFLVMGFTGKKAAAFKEAYIAEFDRMEAELHKREPQPPSPITPIFPVNADFDLLTRFRSGTPVSAEIVTGGKMLIHPSDAVEMMKRVGYIVIHHKDLSNYPAAQIATLCTAARKEEAHWAALPF
ncbi:Rha family transcriptional regulator [Yokenella regensburgei]|uniref:Rha family transcriptional regulator n=1 Tax=Yokenella regensburgei TaxID=158877 RepID=UPI003CD0AA52